METDRTQEIDTREQQAWTPKREPNPKDVAGGAFAFAAMLLSAFAALEWGLQGFLLALALFSIVIGVLVVKDVL